MKDANAPIRELLRRLGPELIVCELAAWAAYHGDRLPREDRNRTLLAIRRMDAIRKAVDARTR